MSILIKVDGIRGALVYTGPAFDTILGTDRVRLFAIHFIDLTRTDLSTVSTAIAFVLVNNRIHN